LSKNVLVIDSNNIQVLVQGKSFDFTLILLSTYNLFSIFCLFRNTHNIVICKTCMTWSNLSEVEIDCKKTQGEFKLRDSFHSRFSVIGSEYCKIMFSKINSYVNDDQTTQFI